MPLPPDGITAAYMERMLGATNAVANFKATFDIVHPDGAVWTIEVTMPEGRLRQESGRVHPGPYDEVGFISDDFLRSAAAFSQWCVRLSLLPQATLQRERAMTIRVLPQADGHLPWCSRHERCTGEGRCR